METTTLPINRLSYSALTQLLRNPLIFKLKYVFNVYDSKIGMSGMIGKAGHEALKAYYGGHPDYPISPEHPDAKGIAKQVGLDFINQFSDQGIEYGKTGSREKLLKDYTQAMDLYFAEEPDYHTVLHCEEKMEAEITTIYGEKMPLPISGIPDLVVQDKKGAVDIIDHKFVRSFTDYETEDYIKIMQAQFMYHLLLAKGIKARRMIFCEIKYSKNADGSQQIREWAVPFDHEPYFVFFYNLFKDVVKFISNPDQVYLPNLSDMFDGEQAGLLYAQGLVSADMSDVEVMHKVRDVAFTSKKFVNSRLDSEVNKHLLPEEKIKLRLAEFGIPVEPVETIRGASVTQYRFKVSAGIRMTTLKKHKDDIARALEARGDVRIVAPIPGTSLVGVEVENIERGMVQLGKEHLKKGTLMVPVGVDVQGNAVHVALDEAPHLLVAGSTGSGKSVLLHSIITALTKQLTYKELELVLIDPKRVELSAFEGIKHVRSGIIYEHDEALIVLAQLVDLMEFRYKAFKKAKVRNIKEFNAKHPEAKMMYEVLVIDEFADLMLQGKKATRKRVGRAALTKIATREFVTQKARQEAKKGKRYDVDVEIEPEKDVEELLVRLAQMARATGIHLVIATQHPTVNVITGLIKANIPTRIALTTASPTDSVVILGITGAEKLSGKGDMLLMSPAQKGIVRLQGFVA